MKNIFTFFTLIILVTLVLSCRDTEQSKLIGIWKRVLPTEPDTTLTEYWKFYEGDKLEVIFKQNNIDSIVEYSYVIKSSDFSIYNPISDANRPYHEAQRDIRGDYWVDELNKENYKITKRANPLGEQGGFVYLRIELIKQ